MRILGAILFILGCICGIIALICLYAVIDAYRQYSGIEMGNEAHGFTSFFMLITFVFSIFCIICCYFGFKIFHFYKE